MLGDRVKDNDSNVYIIVTGTGTIDHRDTIDITIQILLECRIIQVKRLAMKKALCVKSLQNGWFLTSLTNDWIKIDYWSRINWRTKVARY